MVTLSAMLPEIPAQHLADAQVAEEDRRADADRAEPVGLQLQGAARNVRLQHRRVLEAGEAELLAAALDRAGITSM